LHAEGPSGKNEVGGPFLLFTELVLQMMPLVGDAAADDLIYSYVFLSLLAGYEKGIRSCRVLRWRGVIDIVHPWNKLVVDVVEYLR